MIFFQGQKLGKYEIIDSLGSGGFASVYKAVDTWLKKVVAIKIPHQQGGDFNKLLMEPQLLAKLDHENIVKLIAAEKQDSIFFIVMEFVDGASLEDIITDKGKMNTPESIPIIRQITCAVDYAHLNNIIHRDLRPANILIEKSSKVRVADFGISKLLENTLFAKTLIGTPPYMAPEHFDGKTVFASDIYSIGVIFYEMLTGKLPYYDPNPGILKKKLLEESFPAPRVLNDSVPRKINDIILKCLEKEISRRYQRGGDLLMDLDSCMIGSELQKKMAYIRKMILIKEEPKAKVCWNCKRPLPRHVLNCPRCGELL